ncbi:acetyltransferase [Paenibacillus montaniterrae]|uniref:Acetyltransferase n=1 Tax=Paenibacillus montaniterrae TaxID=429341 RepID=A0A919YQM8_9BACL|nr:acetyltransferase [Paenibacillus montaniterrae]GIP16499.1 acetyltransferase [Paenibacillus montaniterrae]
MKNKLIIIGAGGHGKVVADIAIKMNAWDNIYFLDDNRSIQSTLGVEIIGELAEWKNYYHNHDIFVALGNNFARKTIIERLEKEGASIPVLVHPSAIVNEMVEIKHGTVVMAGAVINCYTRIGKGCIINTSSSIDHDNYIGNFVHVSPGVNIAGNVKIGDLSWIGIGSSLVNNIELTKECTVGAGAVVIRSLRTPGTYVGVPAERIEI